MVVCLCNVHIWTNSEVSAHQFLTSSIRPWSAVMGKPYNNNSNNNNNNNNNNNKKQANGHGHGPPRKAADTQEQQWDIRTIMKDVENFSNFLSLILLVFMFSFTLLSDHSWINFCLLKPILNIFMILHKACLNDA